jgi:hypothetical protein
VEIHHPISSDEPFHYPTMEQSSPLELAMVPVMEPPLATFKSMHGIQVRPHGSNAEAPSTERTMETYLAKLSPSQAMAPLSLSVQVSMIKTEFSSAKDTDTFKFISGTVQPGINSAAISKEKQELT